VEGNGAGARLIPVALHGVRTHRLRREHGVDPEPLRLEPREHLRTKPPHARRPAARAVRATTGWVAGLASGAAFCRCK
jgi:hypothetical protein